MNMQLMTMRLSISILVTAALVAVYKSSSYGQVRGDDLVPIMVGMGFLAIFTLVSILIYLKRTNDRMWDGQRKPTIEEWKKVLNDTKNY